MTLKTIWKHLGYSLFSEVRRTMYNVYPSLGLPRPLKIKAVVPSKRREPIYPVTGRHIPPPPKRSILRRVYYTWRVSASRKKPFPTPVCMFSKTLIVIAVQCTKMRGLWAKENWNRWDDLLPIVTRNRLTDESHGLKKSLKIGPTDTSIKLFAIFTRKCDISRFQVWFWQITLFVIHCYAL